MFKNISNRNLLAFATIFFSIIQTTVILFQGTKIAIIEHDLLNISTFILQILFFTLISFLFFSYIISQKGKSLLPIMVLSFPMASLSLIILALGDKFNIFPMISGISTGMFWIARHGYDLILINDDERDKMNGIVVIAQQLLNIIAPFLVGSIMYIATIMKFENTLNIAFGFLSIFILFGIYISFKLPNASLLKWNLNYLLISFKNLVSTKPGINAFSFWSFESSYMGLRFAAYSLAGAIAIQDLITIAKIESFTAILGWLFSILILPMMTKNNRISILSIGSISISIIWLMFSFNPTLASFILLAISKYVLQPSTDAVGLATSQKSIDLLSKNDGTLVMPYICSREIVIFFGLGFPSLLIAWFVPTELQLIICALLISIFAIIGAYIGKRI